MLDADLVLLHGFWSSPARWDKLSQRLHQDPDLEGLRIHAFGYESPRLRWPCTPARIPDYDDIAQSLHPFIVANAPGNSPLVLAAHSQGGLILQRYLAWMLHDGRGGELTRIRLVVLFSCPNEGSEYLRSIRDFTRFHRHPQAGSFKVHDQMVKRTQRDVLRHVVHTTCRDDSNCHIPIHVYSGRTDNVVRRESAQSVFPTAEVLPGDHFSILDPDWPESLTLPTLKGLLLSAARTSGSPDSPTVATNSPDPRASPPNEDDGSEEANHRVTNDGPSEPANSLPDSGRLVTVSGSVSTPVSKPPSSPTARPFLKRFPRPLVVLAAVGGVTLLTAFGFLSVKRDLRPTTASPLTSAPAPASSTTGTASVAAAPMTAASVTAVPTDSRGQIIPGGPPIPGSGRGSATAVISPSPSAPATPKSTGRSPLPSLTNNVGPETLTGVGCAPGESSLLNCVLGPAVAAAGESFTVTKDKAVLSAVADSSTSCHRPARRGCLHLRWDLPSEMPNSAATLGIGYYGHPIDLSRSRQSIDLTYRRNEGNLHYLQLWIRDVSQVSQKCELRDLNSSAWSTLHIQIGNCRIESGSASFDWGKIVELDIVFNSASGAGGGEIDEITFRS
jgi:pimeloyl-ACP methyl ester carboxylesterase